MKKLLFAIKSLLFAVIISMCIYASISFFFLSMNPHDWTEGARYIYSTFGMPISFVVGVMYYVFERKN